MSDTSSNPTTTTTTTNTTNTTNQPISWELIARLTNDEYQARRKDVQKFMDNPKNWKGK